MRAGGQNSKTEGDAKLHAEQRGSGRSAKRAHALGRQAGRERSTEKGALSRLRGWTDRGLGRPRTEISRQMALQRRPQGSPDRDVLGSAPVKGDSISRKLCWFPAILP